MRQVIRFLLFLILTISSLLGFSQVNLTNGLVANYPFNGNTNDISGNNFNGVTANGPFLTSDRFGTPNSAYYFDGIDDFIRIADNGAFSTPQISIVAWFQTESSALQCIVGKRSYTNTTVTGGAQYQMAINYNLFPGIVSNLVGNNNTCTSISSSSYLNSNVWLCNTRWYCVVITFDGSRHKVYIDGALKVDQQTSFSGFLSCNSEIRLGNWWQLDMLPFKGKIDDVRWYNRALNQSEVTALFDNYVSPSSADFSYSQNICNPRTIQFANISTNASSYSWEFGNNTFNTGSANPTVTYSNYGTYNVKLKVQTTYGCVDSVTKSIPINLQQENSLITNNDLSICAGNTTSVNIPDTGLNYCWSPLTGISNINSTNPTITPASTTTYNFISQTLGTNLIVNGDFSSGNTGFSSDYNSVNPNTVQNQYWVGNNPASWNSALSSCVDHTTGTGQMMMVNGSSTINTKIWSQVITVTPNTNYAFSTWVQSLNSLNPARLKFSINGNYFNVNISATSTTCEWRKFFTTWNSGNNTTAIISLVNNNTTPNGNDFAIDDISFSQVIMKQDSIKITVTPPPTVTVTSLPNILCEADSSQLTASGTANYSWTPTTGLSNPNIANPKASPTTTTTYTVSGFNVIGCSNSKPITVTINPKPIITKSANANICRDSIVQISASATNASLYSWFPTTALNNPSISNPLASPSINTNYVVTVTGTNGCSNKDSVSVVVLSKPTVKTRIDTTVCNRVPVTLTTNSTGATSFSWSPNIGLSNATISNPIATPSVSTQYIVTTDNGSCIAKDTINLNILPLPAITKSIDTTICRTGAASLSASGGISYSWLPVYALSNTTSGLTIARPDSTVKYYVTVTGSNNCRNTDSITVTVNPKPIFSLLPLSAAICKGDSILLTASGGDIYSWTPNTNISSTTSAIARVYPSNATTYKVRITNSTCRITDSLTSSITLNGTLTTSVTSSNNIDCSRGQSTLRASGGLSYEWLAAAGITNLSSATTIVAPTKTTTYYVKITDSRGCTALDSVKVNVDFTIGKSQYAVASAFTPNGDGKNDCLGLKYWGAVTDLDFGVYSRWGHPLFHTTNPNDCWDGRYKGLQQDAGTYIYQIKAKTPCGDVYRKGTVVLIR